jgi:hypothetical protein
VRPVVAQRCTEKMKMRREMPEFKLLAEAEEASERDVVRGIRMGDVLN